MNELWNTLLRMKCAVTNTTEKVSYCTFVESGELFFNELGPQTEKRKCIVYFDELPTGVSTSDAVFQFTENIQTDLVQKGKLTSNEVDFLMKYLPLCFLPILARKENRAISIAHFAQTLDGKIATASGDSKWIGNEENLIHAHRMRALCDGILIGNHTLKVDKPRLTVRMVEGVSPRRVVIGSTCQNYTSLLESGTEEIIVMGAKNGYDKCTKQLDFIELQKKDGIIPPTKILENLYQEKGIHSVYIEGGATTTSCFLNQDAIDVLQLHIAPMVFGSGKSGINLPIINKVDQAIKFRSTQFHKIGSEIMFTGRLETAKKELQGRVLERIKENE